MRTRELERKSRRILKPVGGQLDANRRRTEAMFRRMNREELGMALSALSALSVTNCGWMLWRDRDDMVEMIQWELLKRNDKTVGRRI